MTRAPVALALLLSGCGALRVPALPAPGPEAVPGGMGLEREWADARGLAGERDCFRRHLREAISLNERRLPLYSGWTDGASEEISRTLIATERRGLAAGWLVDRRARRFQAAGIPIVCAEFVSMSLTPSPGGAPGLAPTSPYEPGPDPRALEEALGDAYRLGGFTGLARRALVEIAALEAAPAYNCMVRHLLESIARTAAMAPLHVQAARAAGLPSTAGLSELMIRLHLAVLVEAAAVDRAAAPLQARGVPIVCMDVPPVPYPQPMERPNDVGEDGEAK